MLYLRLDYVYFIFIVQEFMELVLVEFGFVIV